MGTKPPIPVDRRVQRLLDNSKINETILRQALSMRNTVGLPLSQDAITTRMVQIRPTEPTLEESRRGALPNSSKTERHQEVGRRRPIVKSRDRHRTRKS